MIGSGEDHIFWLFCCLKKKNEEKKKEKRKRCTSEISAVKENSGKSSLVTLESKSLSGPVKILFVSVENVEYTQLTIQKEPQRCKSWAKSLQTQNSTFNSFTTNEWGTFWAPLLFTGLTKNSGAPSYTSYKNEISRHIASRRNFLRP